MDTLYFNLDDLGFSHRASPVSSWFSMLLLHQFLARRSPTRPVYGQLDCRHFHGRRPNYHHEFQWDYRNGVKPWQLDPSKWFIWTLYKLGLASDLKRVPKEKILLAETRETKRQVTDRITSIQESQNSNEALWTQVLENLEVLSERLTEISNELQTAAHDKINLSKTKLREIRNEVRAMLEEINSSPDLKAA